MGAELIVGAIISLVGAGVSAYGQYQSGKTQNAIAQYNAQQQTNNARLQMQAMQAQARIQNAQAAANLRLRTAEANARFQNAKAKEQQALSQDAVNRVNLEKKRDDYARMQGQQRAAIAASGVVESEGSPVDLIAETAAKIQLDLHEQHAANENNRRTLFAEASMERLGGKLALAGATLDYNSAVAEAGLRSAAAQATYLSGTREAEITRLTGGAAARAGSYQAGATLLSGANTALGYYKG